jgi:hypothetical protein
MPWKGVLDTMSKHNEPIIFRAESASITTVSVTIRSLRIDNRQLTQSVFRQLQERPLIDIEEPKLLGTIWGWVNYNPDTHYWGRQFIVQFDQELYRCPFPIRYSDVVMKIMSRYDGDFAFIHAIKDIDRLQWLLENVEDYAIEWDSLMCRLENIPQLFIAS